MASENRVSSALNQTSLRPANRMLMRGWNLIARILIIGVIASGLQYRFEFWWLAVITAFMVELVIGKGDRTGFFSGFYGVSIPWMILAFYIDRTTDSVLTYRVLELFRLPQSAIVLVIVTGLIGGLAGGVASLSASWLKASIKNA
jgi:hypothetical protein